MSRFQGHYWSPPLACPLYWCIRGFPQLTNWRLLEVCTTEQEPLFVPGDDILCWLFCSLVCIPYGLISLQPPENHLDMFCSAESAAPSSSQLQPSRVRRRALARVLARRAPTTSSSGEPGGGGRRRARARAWVELLTPLVLREIAYLGMPVLLE